MEASFAKKHIVLKMSIVSIRQASQIPLGEIHNSCNGLNLQPEFTGYSQLIWWPSQSKNEQPSKSAMYCWQGLVKCKVFAFKQIKYII